MIPVLESIEGVSVLLFIHYEERNSKNENKTDLNNSACLYHCAESSRTPPHSGFVEIRRYLTSKQVLGILSSMFE